MFKNRYYLIILIVLIFSCQPIEKLDKIAFNYESLTKIDISAKKKNVINLYEFNYNDPYIDHSLENSPVKYLNTWVEKNINVFGNENTLEINILDASLKKIEIENNDSKKYKEKKIFLFEINFLIELILYDNNNNLLSNIIVEAKRSTTSSRYISIQKNESIIELLVFNCLIDISNKADELVKKHFMSFIL